jgi:hypothetical protein
MSISLIRVLPRPTLGPSNQITGNAGLLVNFWATEDLIDTDRIIQLTGSSTAQSGGPNDRPILTLSGSTANIKFKPIPTVVSTVINGAATITEGFTAQYTITGTLSDGTTADLSAYTTWVITSGSAYASINSSGLVSTVLVTQDRPIIIQATTTYKGSTIIQTRNVTVDDIPTLVSVQIYGGNTIDEQQTRQYTTEGTMSDGSTKILTANTVWSITVGATYGSISASGVLTTNSISGGNKSMTIQAVSTDPVSNTSATTTYAITVVDSIASGLTLSAAITSASATSGLVVVLDAGDASSYGGSGNNVFNVGSGGAYFIKPSGTTFTGSAGALNSYFVSNDQASGWFPDAGHSPTPWSNLLHKAGGKYSWCMLLRINSLGASSQIPLFHTWDNSSTGSTGILTTLGFNATVSRNCIINRAWRTGTNTALNTYADLDISIGTWIFLASAFGDNVTTFVRQNNAYLNTRIYRKGTTNTTVNATTIQQTYATPSANNPPLPFRIFGGGVSGLQSGTIDVAMIGFWNTNLSAAQFDSIFNSVKGRYGIA